MGVGARAVQLTLGKERILFGICAAAVALLLLARALPAGPAPLPAGTSMLTVHLLMEMFAVTIAVLIVTVTWHTFDSAANPEGNLLIAGFIVVGVCDLAHALSYEGMPSFLGATSTRRSIFYWLMGRSGEALTLGLIAVDGIPALTRRQSVLIGTAVGALLVWIGSAHIAWFPQTFVDGVGVTAFKASYEGALCLTDVLLAGILWAKAVRRHEPRFRIIAASAFVIGVGELSFTSYGQPSDFINIFGHAHKLVAYALLYWATYIASIRMPYEAKRVSELRAIESEWRIRTLSDNIPNSMVYQVTRDAGGHMRFLHVSEGCERLYGIRAAEMLRDAYVMYDRIEPADREQLREAADHSTGTMATVDMQIRARHRDGRLRWIRVVSAPRPLEGGVVCWDGIQFDVTEQRATEARARESAAMLEAVFDSANDAIIGVDASERIAVFNPAAQRIFRYPADAILGRPLSAILPGDEISGARAPELNLHGRLGASRVRGLRSDGAQLDMEMSVSGLELNGQQYFAAIMRDITDRVRTERALVQYQVELTELTQALLAQEKSTTSRLAQALHDELGQTLAAIRIDFVSEVPLAGPDERARHARVDRLIDQAVREVRGVLAGLRPTVLDESGLVQALENELATPRLSAEDLAVELTVAPDLRELRWEPDVEYAAFMVAREAISNVMRHARATQVRICVSGNASALRLEVRDNGAGFEPAAQSARPGHLGMIGMRERSIAIGARFEVDTRPGEGTSVVLSWQEREQ